MIVIILLKITKDSTKDVVYKLLIKICRRLLKNLFSKELNRQLLEYYGRIPSAAVLARDYNLRAANAPQISQEAARRWIRGLSIPEMDKIHILVNW
jgi:hypothetical protein